MKPLLRGGMSMKCYITYASKTGNTKKIADVIENTLRLEEHEVCCLPIEEKSLGFDPDLYFVGFGIEKGECSKEASAFLKTLHNQKIALFGTVGLGGSDVYYQQISEKVRKFIPKDNEIEGYFFCQGKMPLFARKKYEEILNTYPHNEPVQLMLQNYDKALTHPDETDLKNAKIFTERIMKKVMRIHE